MVYHTIQAWLRKALPRFVSEAIRSLATAVLAPVYFSVRTGHFRSSLRRRAVDPDGNAIPWYTYPTIDFLKYKEYTGRAVLEFGAGQSTHWWARRAAQVVSFEADRAWYEEVRKSIPSNATVYHISDNLSGFDELIHDRCFDVVIVDGLDRAVATEKALRHLKPDGCIIVDNSEGHWGPPGTYPIMDLLRKNGYRRIDFYGHAPGVLLSHCTSLFFRNDCFLLKGNENPVRSDN